MDHRPSELDPYPRGGRDLAALDHWERSLARSLQRRRLTEAGRSNRQRRRGTSMAVSAAMLAAPIVPPLAGAKGVSARSGDAATLDTSSIGAATQGRLLLLRVGDQGAAVAAVQRQLAIAADGIYGPITQRSVAAFQGRHGLAATGTVDARTWGALFNGRVLFYDRSSEGSAAARPAIAVRVVADRESDDGLLAPRDGDGPVSADGGRGPAAPEDEPPVVPEGKAAPSEPSPEPEAPPEPAAPSAPSTSGDGCTTGTVSAPVEGTPTGRYGDDRRSHRHAGLDLSAPSGTPVRAVQCGTVTQSGASGDYGLMVCVRHGAGVTTCYAHLSRTKASVSQRVRAGETIGYVGCTGRCTGPHVHVEVRRGGSTEDPAPYLAGQRTLAGTASAAKASAATLASVRRAKTTSAGASSGTATASARPAAEPVAVAEPTAPEQPATAPAPAPAAEQPAAEPTPTPAAEPAAEQPAAAPTPTPAAEPAAEQPAAAPTPTPDPEPAAEQPAAAPTPTPATEPAAEQPAAAPTPTPATEPAAEQPAAAPAPTPAAEQPAAAPAPTPAAEQPAAAPEQPTSDPAVAAQA